MKLSQFVSTVIIGILLAVLNPSSVWAAPLSWNNGVYTNLCGSGTGDQATADTCNRGCNPSTGSCSGPAVVKYTCQGKVNECRDNESSFQSSQSVTGVNCSKTVQLDVFKKNCRVGGNWTCTDSDLLDFMAWYSGDCTTTSAPIPACDASQLTMSVSPNPANIGDSVTFSDSGSQGSTWISDSWSGGVSCSGSVWGSKSCPANSSGSFTWAHSWRNCVGSFDHCGSTCSKQVQFTINNNYTSSCDSLGIQSGNNSLVPATVSFHVNASDSGGSIQTYRWYFGDGNQQDSSNNEISHQYQSSGTFYVHVDVKDSRGNWKSSSGCQATVTVNPVYIESHKSGCSNVFITGGNYTQPPTTGTFQVTGYDNKGSISNYKIDFGDGTTQENTGNTFTHSYGQSGTYTVRGYIYDSQNNWIGGDNSCQQSFYVNTKPLTNQPSTGTPTAFTLAALTSGTVGFGLLFALRLGWIPQSIGLLRQNKIRRKKHS